MWASLVKMKQKLNPRFKIKKEKVSTYLDHQLSLLRFLGLFKLADDILVRPYRHLLQKIYIRFTFTYSIILLTLSYLCILFRASNSFIEVFKNLVETVAVSTLCMDIMLLNIKNTELLRLLDKMNTFDVTSKKSIYSNARKIERLIYVCYCVLIGFAMGIKYVIPFLPISSQHATFVQKVYGFKYPQKRLPMCLWIPYIDTSEPLWFPLFYLIEMYSAVLWFGLAITDALFYPFILLHFCGQHLVLASKLKNLGRSSVRPRMRTLRRTLCDNRLREEQEIFEVKKCILFHRKLCSFRLQVKYFLVLKHF
uniref:Odorant receptor n=1 Tax=Cacopsylla melanoneura TaxID=428564 RepID=A0A8D8Z814_9HEMI